MRMITLDSHGEYLKSREKVWFVQLCISLHLVEPQYIAYNSTQYLFFKKTK